MARGRLDTATGLALGLRALYALPGSARRALAGPPIQVDGARLDHDMQLFLRLQRFTGRGLVHTSVETARRNLEEGDRILRGPLVTGVATRDLRLDDGLPARLYTPQGGAAGTGMLVFYHGGGWVVGSIDSHDNLCRFLARHAGVPVLSVGYRRAPEHPFPAAAHDAYAGFRYAVRHAAEWDVDPARIAVGGDSAGGNLAIVAALQAVAAGGPLPAYQLLIYPATDHTTRRPSRERFADGFFLTDASMTWFGDHYAGDADRSHPLLSPLLAPDLGELPPGYLAVAGFDPLRDEGLAFAERLAEVGVAVAHRCFDDLIHGYANFFGFSVRAREAVADAASALRQAVGSGTGLPPDSRPGTVTESAADGP